MDKLSPYKDCSRVEDHASEWTVLNVLIVVRHVNSPLPRLVWLETSVECSIVLAHRTAQGSVGWRVGGHLQQLRSGCVVWVDLKQITMKISTVKYLFDDSPEPLQWSQQHMVQCHRNPS